MAQYARDVMGAIELAEPQFFSGDWLSLLPQLLENPGKKRPGDNGADQIAWEVL